MCLTEEQPGLGGSSDLTELAPWDPKLQEFLLATS